MNIVDIIAVFILVVLGSIVLWAVINIIKFVWMFHGRKCKYCNHIMKFKRYNDGLEGKSYDFHCEHCGAWERVSIDELFGDNETSAA